MSRREEEVGGEGRREGTERKRKGRGRGGEERGKGSKKKRRWKVEWLNVIFSSLLCWTTPE